MARRTSRSRPSLLLLVLLLCALAVGAAVSLIDSARTAGPPPPVGPTSELLLPPWVVSVAIVGFALSIILPLIYTRLRTKGSGQFASSFIVGAFALLLAGVVVVALLHVLGAGGTLQTVQGAPTSNGTGKVAQNTTCNCTAVRGPGGVLAPFNLALPPWTLFVLVALAAVVVVVAGLPPLREYLEDRRENRLMRARTVQLAAQVQQALRDAARDLEGALDPRATILALYATLLARIEPMAMNLDRSTPEEIRHQHLTRLGIRPPAAEDLTRVFEEARYSSHPLGPEQVDRARRAIRAAEEDLTRAEPAA
jgi:hypothetical protein